MLLSREDAASSVTEQTVNILKRKWQNINNKVEERKVIHNFAQPPICGQVSELKSNKCLMMGGFGLVASICICYILSLFAHREN